MNNVMIVSGEQQRDSATHMHTYPFSSKFNYRDGKLHEFSTSAAAYPAALPSLQPYNPSLSSLFSCSKWYLHSWLMHASSFSLLGSIPHMLPNQSP